MKKWLFPKRWLYAAAGGLAILAFWWLDGPERRGKKVRHQRDNLLLDKTRVAQEKAKKLSKRADKHQANAVAAGEVGKKVMDNVGKSSESTADLLDSWRKPVDGL